MLIRFAEEVSRTMPRTITLAIAAIALLTMENNLVAQQDAYRLETDVYVGSETRPVYQTLTLFKDSIAYDIPHGSSTITVIDVNRSRITLLDSTRQVQTHVELAQLIRLIGDARKQAGPLQPIVEESSKVVETSGSLVVGGEIIRYEATMQDAPEKATAITYAKFADAVAYLNGSREAASLPFARLTLNREIAKRSKLPHEVTKTVSLGRKPTVQRSKLHATWSLNAENEKRIAAIDEMMKAFPVLEHPEYFKSPLQTSGLSTTRR